MSKYMPVEVFNEYSAFESLEDETKRAVEYVLTKETRKAEIGIVFVNDEKILELNKKYLHHDYITDVISFPIEETEGIIEGEIYICIDQAERQAKEYGVTLSREIVRLVIHGVLHLIGYDDRTSGQKAVMSDKEENYLIELKG